MSRSGTLRFLAGAACLAILLPWVFTVSHAQQTQAVAIDNDDIGGVVTGPNGPEAGVWVIAETRDLAVRYIKSVVTDDRGRYVVPDLPKANYSVWARGYGLVDSAKVTSEPGKLVNLTAKPAPDAAAAAHYYPAIYWYSMLNIPGADQFGKKGSDIPGEHHADRVAQRDQEQRLCRLPPARTGVHAYHPCGLRHIRVRRNVRGSAACSRGRPGQQMMAQLAPLGNAPLKHFGNWTDRIAKGELPHAKPMRPQGVERNIVVTLRDWMDEKHYLHDLISSDKRNPTVNAYGPLYGSPEYSSDLIPILDPVKNTTTTFKAPVRDRRYAAQPGSRARRRAQTAAAVRLLGRGDDLGHEGQQSQLDVRPDRQALADRLDPRREQPGLLQAGLGSSLRQAVPDRASEPSPGDVRPQDRRNTRSSIPASGPITRSSASTATTRSGRAAAARSSAG